MSGIRRNSVKIVNPKPGAAQYTTFKSACQFVRRGLATFDGEGAIRFVEQNQDEQRQPKYDCGDEFRWHFGSTGGMVQVVASRIPSSRISDVHKRKSK